MKRIQNKKTTKNKQTTKMYAYFRFVLHMMSQGSYNGDRVTAMLNVVETNPFKHLTHLSLKFVPGSDTDVKKYLADCLKQFKVCSPFKTELILWIVFFL